MRDNIDNLRDEIDNLRYSTDNLRDKVDDLGNKVDNLHSKWLCSWIKTIGGPFLTNKEHKCSFYDIKLTSHSDLVLTLYLGRIIGDPFSNIYTIDIPIFVSWHPPLFFFMTLILCFYHMIAPESLVPPLVLALPYCLSNYALGISTPFVVCSCITSIPLLCCGIGFLYIPNFSLSAWTKVFFSSLGFSNDMAFLSTKSWITSLNFWHSHILCPQPLWYP